MGDNVSVLAWYKRTVKYVIRITRSANFASTLTNISKGDFMASGILSEIKIKIDIEKSHQ